MPTIYSVSSSFFGSASWNNPSTWIGGIVPTSSDTVILQGIRTFISASNILPWTGSTMNIPVNRGSISRFPSSSYFFTYTERDEELKINYVTCSTDPSSSYFISCSVDTSYNSWSLALYPNTASFPDKRGGVILNGSFVHFRPGNIEVSGSMIVSASQILLESGSSLVVKDGGTLKFTNYILGRDAAFIVTGSGSTVAFDRHYTSSFGTGDDNLINYIAFENFPMQTALFEGPEVRLNTVLTQSASVGDTFLRVNSTTGFTVGDWIFVGEESVSSSRSDNGFRSASAVSMSSQDEMFQVAAIDTGSRFLYVQRFNGIEGKVLATSSATEIIMDEERYKVGDKVVINGQTRTITAITSSFDYLLKDYNFQSGSTLSEWDTDLTRSGYFNDWTAIPSVGLTQFTTNLYRHLFVKNIYRDAVKVEAFISNQRNEGGVRSDGALGICIHADPTADFDYTDGGLSGWGPSRTYLATETSGSTRMWLRPKNQYHNPNVSMISASLSLTGLKKYTLEYTKGYYRGYINDVMYFEEANRGGVMAGRVGVFSSNNNAFVCTRLIVYAKGQKITLDSGVTGVDTNTIVYESGVEHPHSTNNKVIKLASVVTDPLDHLNLAFSNIGSPEHKANGIFPYIYGANNTGSLKNGATGYGYLVLNDDIYASDLDLGVGQNRSVILDLATPTTFSSVGFVETFLVTFQNFSSSFGVRISGSNDSVNWTPLTQSFDRRYRINPDTVREYFVGPQVYRFVRIETNGLFNAGGSNNTNRFRNFVVRNQTLNQIQVNNSSDLGVGDHVVVVTRTANYPYYIGTAFDGIARNTELSGSYLSKPGEQHYTITSKTGSILTLDRPFNDGHIHKGATVVKVNRLVNFSGSYTTNSWKTGRIRTNDGFSYVKRIIFKNVGFQNLNDRYPTFTSGSSEYRGAFVLRETNQFNFLSPIQGCSFYNGGADQYPFNFDVRSGYTVRHNYIGGFGDAGFSNNTLFNNTLAGSRFPTNYPVIITGNILHSMIIRNPTVSLFSTYNFSYNLMAGMNYGLPRPLDPNMQTFLFSPWMTIYKAYRNLLRGIRGSALDLNVAISQYQNSPVLLDIRDNKFEFVNYFALNITGYTDTPIIRPLLPAVQSSALNRISRWNATGSTAWLSTGSSNLYGETISYVKDNNRYGYDMWTNRKGYIIKEPTDPFYKFYNFHDEEVRNPMLQAMITVGEDITASFEVNFDYFHTLNQVYNNQTPKQGGLFFFVLKNGAEIQPLTRRYNATVQGNFCLNPTATPTNFSEVYQLEGQGIYQIGLGQGINSGYVALSNISSRLILPSETDKVVVNMNSFNMRYFEKGERTSLKSSYTQTLVDPKFRLRGTRIF
jgi:hypothetical protein